MYSVCSFASLGTRTSQISSKNELSRRVGRWYSIIGGLFVTMIGVPLMGPVGG